MCDTLRIPESDRKKFITSLTSSRNALKAAKGSGLNTELAKLVAFRAASQDQELQISGKEILQQAQRDSLPADVFLLPSLPQLDTGAAVVMLRELVGVPNDSIRYIAADATSSAEFLRIGRLHPTMKYAISQAFGALHWRIGLPRAYELRCKAALESIGQLAWE